MLATVILDTYTNSEFEFLADVVEEVASASDNYGWSSSGIYCFWDPLTKECLYIGLAVDLPTRFRQHNGLSSCPEECCKLNKIEEYFRSRSILGYSILVQSKISQGICDRWIKANRKELDFLCERYGFVDHEEAKKLLNVDVNREIRTYEAALIEAVKVKTGELPPWNRIAGSDIQFGESEIRTGTHLLRSLTGGHDGVDPLAAHVRLRDLSINPTYQGYEELLHASRMFMLSGISTIDAYRRTYDPLHYFSKMDSDGYITKQVQL